MTGRPLTIYIPVDLYEDLCRVVEEARRRLREYGIRLPGKGVTVSSVISLVLRRARGSLLDMVLEEYIERSRIRR